MLNKGKISAWATVVTLFFPIIMWGIFSMTSLESGTIDEEITSAFMIVFGVLGIILVPLTAFLLIKEGASNQTMIILLSAITFLASVMILTTGALEADVLDPNHVTDSKLKSLNRMYILVVPIFGIFGTIASTTLAVKNF